MKSRRQNKLVFLFLWIAVLGPQAAAFTNQPLTVRTLASHDRFRPGEAYRLAVVLEIASPWHVNANPASAGLIPTTVTLKLPAGWSLEDVDYPAGDAVRPHWASEPIRLYSGQVPIMIDVRVGENATTGPVTVSGNLRYQACDDRRCLAPTTLPLEWTLQVVPGGTPVIPQHAELFQPESVATADSLPIIDSADVGPTPADQNTIAQTIEERGWVIALALVFVGGLALNLTPCVYPMIAITVSVFGGQGERGFASALAHASAYCLGIVITYSVLGLAAALTGGLFGALLQSPIVLVGIAVLMVVLALSMFGVYELRPPSFLVNKAAGISSQAGYVGVFLLGATVGVIAAPCLAPILVALLAYVGQRADPWVGWWLFFTLALGLGTPYIILGTFSGLLSRLPKSGAWMVNVKRVFGLILIAVAVWFVLPLIHKPKPLESLIKWQPYRQDLAIDAGRPVLIDFFADWCIPCLEMDARTFRDPRVVAKANEFLMLKVDLTRDDAIAMHAVAEDYGILGIPTFIFLNAAGEEYEELRLTGFVPADVFVKVMDRALAGSAATKSMTAEERKPPDIPPQLMNPF